MSVNGVGAPTTTASVSGSSGTGSLQFLFAQLQLEQAELAKEDATSYLDKVKAGQEEQQYCSAMIAEATRLKEEAETGKKCTTMTPEMIAYFEDEDNDLTFDHAGNDYAHDAEQWDLAIESLSARRDTLGTTTQTDMVYIEDFMGQYNSYLTGANSTIDGGNQTLQTIMS